jgi:hypothetical protein
LPIGQLAAPTAVQRDHHLPAPDEVARGCLPASRSTELFSFFFHDFS